MKGINLCSCGHFVRCEWWGEQGTFTANEIDCSMYDNKEDDPADLALAKRWAAQKEEE